MKKIRILTTTRADFSLLKPVYDALMELGADVSFLVTGTHLSKEYGFTVDKIELLGAKTAAKINIMPEKNLTVSQIMANAMTKFDSYFRMEKPDLLLVLGDRYETLAVALAAFNSDIITAHMHGGEKTTGAKDDCMRHAITKFSRLHFTSCEAYRKRVIQLGENPDFVFNVGSVGVENALSTEFFTREENAVNLNIKPEENYAICTFHPETFSNMHVEESIRLILNALKQVKWLKFIFTAANADDGGDIINKILKNEASENENLSFFESLGGKNYLSAVKYSKFVFGNSSSGIIEAPSLKVPTVNIGERQSGRVRAGSVIDVKMEQADILRGINIALSEDFAKNSEIFKNPYQGENTSRKIAQILIETSEKKISGAKEFYDVDFEY